MVQVPGWEIHELESVDSTQDEVRRRLAAGSAPPLAVRAAEQRLGRGRRGNRWESPPGGLWLSFAIGSPIPADPFLGLLVAYAALRTIAEDLPPTTAEPPRLALKWPNDLVVEDARTASLRKWGGVIAEVEPVAATRLDPRSKNPRSLHLIFGVGLDLAIDPPDLPAPAGSALAATSIRAEFGQAPSPGSVLPRILSRFDRLLVEDRVAGGRDRSIDRLTPHLATLGRPVRWTGRAVPLEGPDTPALIGEEEIAEISSQRGTALGLAPDGGLIVALDLVGPRTEGGAPHAASDPRSTRRAILRSGEVHHLREFTPRDGSSPTRSPSEPES